jgi:hypothetical protein
VNGLDVRLRDPLALADGEGVEGLVPFQNILHVFCAEDGGSTDFDVDEGEGGEVPEELGLVFEGDVDEVDFFREELFDEAFGFVGSIEGEEGEGWRDREGWGGGGGEREGGRGGRREGGKKNSILAPNLIRECSKLFEKIWIDLCLH